MDSKRSNTQHLAQHLAQQFNKIRLVTAISVSLLLGACGGEDVDTEFQNHLDRAKAYQGQGQYKAAVIEYRNAVKKSQGRPEVMVQFADVMNEMGNHQGAKSYLEVLEGEDSERYYLELIETYIAVGKFQSAGVALEKLTEPTREKLLLQAELMTKTGKFDEARELYDRLLNNNVGDGRAYVGLATLEAMQGNYDAALGSIAKVTAIDLAYTKAKLIKAGIEITRDQLSEAEATLSTLLGELPTTDQMLPDKVLTLERLSYVLTRLGRSNEAYIYTKILSEAFPGATEANDSFQLALKDFQEGRLDEAKHKLEAVVRDYPGHARSRQVLGIISYMKGDAQAAAGYLDDVVDPETSSPLATQVYMATNLKLNEPKRVLDALEPTIEQQTSVELLALYGLASVSDKQYVKGEAALLKAAAIQPDNVRLQLTLASFYRTTPGADRAKELPYLEKAFELAPTQRQVLIDVASHYVRASEFDKAKALLINNAKAHPDDYTANLLTGQFLAAQGDTGASDEYLKIALNNAEPGQASASAHGALGRNALISNNNSEARARFSAMVDAMPENVAAYAGLYESDNRLVGQETALTNLENLAKEKESFSAYQALVRIALSNKNISAAERFYESAAKMDPDANEQLTDLSSRIDYARALDYLRTGQLEKARDVAATSLVASPGNIRIVAVLAEVEIKSGNFNEAEKVLAQLAEHEQRLGYILPALRGDLALAKKDFGKARTNYEAAWALAKAPAVAEKLHRVLGLQKDEGTRSAFLTEWYEAQPDNLLVMLLVGMESQQNGDVAKAESVYEALLKQRPDSVAALNNLGWIYYEKGDEEALKLLKRASDLAPNSSAVLDSYGWVLHKFGRTSEGLPFLEQAVSLQPDNAEIKAHYEEAKKAL